MEGIHEGRHLAAIMFVDMVGYSAHMQENEPRAIAAVRELWELVRPVLAESYAIEGTTDLFFAHIPVKGK